MIVAYDYDGVIVDSLDPNIDMMNEVLSEMGLEPAIDREMFQSLKVISFEAMAGPLGLSDEELQTFMAKIHERNDDLYHKTPLFDGMKSHLERVAASAKVYLVSNNTTSLVENLFEKEGLHKSFSGLLGPETGMSKAERLESLKRDGEHIVFVGDGVSDITEGNKADVITVAVSWGFQSLELLKEHNPRYTVESLHELEQLLIG